MAMTRMNKAAKFGTIASLQPRASRAFFLRPVNFFSLVHSFSHILIGLLGPSLDPMTAAHLIHRHFLLG
ncbi:uncharacterized protein BDW47DRAFT_114221 [Aspergillus candidus]|uniref:Uncharacterized protein n=1 Tax=Aspergillus candidus TaxID=41067 RepID=A0A2I2EY40_ASPCN|nr:hypothetical protein BDW47DRAFT_114221 [Aspergillus candidus]PLB33292.1 hypothetical protein BDW47DRAFT_114221 [Aspergillus candidus]